MTKTQQDAAHRLDITGQLARAILLCDLLTTRLALAYRLDEAYSSEVSDELGAALERVNKDTQETLEAAQGLILGQK